MRAHARPHTQAGTRERALTHIHTQARAHKQTNTNARTHARKHASTHSDTKAVGFGPLLIGTARAGTLPAAPTRSSGCSLSGTGRAVGDLDGRHLGRTMPNVSSGALGSLRPGKQWSDRYSDPGSYPVNSGMVGILSSSQVNHAALSSMARGQPPFEPLGFIQQTAAADRAEGTGCMGVQGPGMVAAAATRTTEPAADRRGGARAAFISWRDG